MLLLRQLQIVVRLTQSQVFTSQLVDQLVSLLQTGLELGQLFSTLKVLGIEDFILRPVQLDEPFVFCPLHRDQIQLILSFDGVMPVRLVELLKLCAHFCDVALMLVTNLTDCRLQVLQGKDLLTDF